MVQLPDDILRPRDTSIEAWEIYIGVLRKMTPEQRMLKGFQLTDMARRVAMHGIKERHPDYSDKEVKLALLRMTITEGQWKEHFGDLEIRP